MMIKKRNIIVLLLFSLFLVLPNIVNAENISYTNGTYDFVPIHCVSATECHYNGVALSSYANASIGWVFSPSAIGLDDAGNQLNAVQNVTIKMNVNLVANQNYSFTFVFKTNSNNMNMRGTYLTSAKYKPTTDGDIYSFSVDTIKRNTGTNSITLTFTPSFNAAYVQFTISLGVYNYIQQNIYRVSNIAVYPLNQFGVLSASISTTSNDTSSTTNSISQQTTVIENKTNAILNQQEKTNSLLSSDDTDEATSKAGEFFSGFETNTFGLTSIITAPLNLIQSITSSTCSPVGIPIPYVNKTLNLPCLGSIYSEHFGAILTIYQTITFGIVSYWVCVRIFNLVKDFKNPDHDEIEVVDL